MQSKQLNAQVQRTGGPAKQNAICNTPKVSRGSLVASGPELPIACRVNVLQADTGDLGGDLTAQVGHIANRTYTLLQYCQCR